jgi:hypothetical protein
MTLHADLSSPAADATEDVASDRPPDFLTVEEAARVLRIARTSAYQLAKRWCFTDGREGLPVVRVGRLLRVPRHGLERLAGGELGAAPPSVVMSSAEAALNYVRRELRASSPGP